MQLVIQLKIGSSLLLLYLICLSLAAGDDSCRVISCDGMEPGDKLQDPYNCKRYYVCLTNCNISNVVFECEGDQLFDNVIHECESPSNVNCSICEPKCTRFWCNDGVDEVHFAADPADCAKYYICGLSDFPIPVECPTNTFFDGQNCQEDEGLCCDPCVVYCETAFTQIPDPTNCNNFYYCPLAAYYPQEEDLNTCPNGQVFSPEEGLCSKTADCKEPICQGTVIKSFTPVFDLCY